MSDNIEIDIEINADKATDSIDDVTDSTQKLEKETQSLSKKMKKAFDSNVMAVEKLKNKMKGIGEDAKSIGKGIAAVGIAAAAVVASTLAFQSLTQNIRAADKAFQLKGGAEGVETLRRMQDYGHAAGLGLDNVNKIAQKLGNAFDPASAEYLMQVIGDSKARGADIEKLGEEFAKLSVKTGIGKGDMEQWFEATGMIAPSVEQISKATGKSFKEVEKAVEAGTLSTTDFIKAVDESNKSILGIQKTGEGGIKFGASDMEGQINRIGDSWEAFKMSLLQKMTSTGALTAISSLADSVDKLVKSKEFDGFVSGIVSGIKSMIDMFKFLTSGTTEAKVTLGLLGVALVAVMVAIAPIPMAIAGVVAAIGLLVVYADKIMGPFVEAYQAIESFFTKLPGMASAKVSELGTMITAGLSAIVVQATQFGSNIIDGLINGLMSGIGKITSAVSSVTGAIKGVFTGDLKMHSPSKLTESYGGYIDEGLAIGTDKGIPDVERAIGNVTSTVESGVEKTESPQLSLPGIDNQSFAAFQQTSILGPMTPRIQQTNQAPSTKQNSSTNSVTVSTNINIGSEPSIAEKIQANPEAFKQQISALLKATIYAMK